ncbi:MAG: hypothetical protein Q9157_004974 [Trypethelium eluteriae]
MNSVESNSPAGSGQVADLLDSIDQLIDPRLLALDNEKRQSDAANRPSKSKGRRPPRSTSNVTYRTRKNPEPWEQEIVRKQITSVDKDCIYTRGAAEGFRPLLNTAIEEAAGIDLLEIPSPDDLVLQLGASRWSQKEFEIFLRALARKGKNATKDIATAIGSKSEVQTQSLLLHLRAASQQEQQYKTSGKLLDYTTQVPAAFEISDGCCEALEYAATSLAWKCEKQDVTVEFTRHGENWLLDNKMAAKLDRAYNREENDYKNDNPDPDSDGGEGGGLIVDTDPGEESDEENSNEEDGAEIEPEPHEYGPATTSGIQTDGGIQQSKEDEENERAALEYWPAARLFVAPNWLSLMDELFMRQVPPEGPYEFGNAPDWRALALEGQVPSIYYTAFSDFHSLIVNVTRRLVQAVINQAHSRLRASDKYSGQSLNPLNKVPMIFTADVEAARDLLGMPQNSREILAGVARKCRLQMTKYRKGVVRVTDHFTTEQAVLQLTRYSKQYEAACKMAAAAEPSNDSLENWDSADFDDSTDEHQEDQEVLSTGEGPANETMSRKRKRLPKFEDRAEPYLRLDQWTEAYDRVQAAQEELRLWQVLGRDPPLLQERAASAKPSLGSGRAGLPKFHADAEDSWENYTDYRAEWETYGDYHIPRNAFWATELRRDYRRAKRAKRKMDVQEAKAARSRHDADRQDTESQGQPSDREPSARGEEEIEEQTIDGFPGDGEGDVEEQPIDGFQEDDEIYEDDEAPLSFADEGLYTGLYDDPSVMFGAEMVLDAQGDIGEEFVEGI